MEESYVRLKNAEYLRAVTTRVGLACGLVWMLSKGDLVDRANAQVERVSNKIVDLRHAAFRTRRWQRYTYNKPLPPNKPFLERCRMRWQQFSKPDLGGGDPLITKPWRVFPIAQLPLLPDRKDMRIPPSVKTLVVDMDVLFSDIRYDEGGWKLMKRPHVDEFLKVCNRNFELIIWSDEKFPIGQSIINKCGVANLGVLHADDTRLGRKDLGRLGRDLAKVMRVTGRRETCMHDQELNTLFVDYSEPACVKSLTSYISSVAVCTNSDVRDILKSRGNDQAAITKYDQPTFLSSLIDRLGF